MVVESWACCCAAPELGVVSWRTFHGCGCSGQAISIGVVIVGQHYDQELRLSQRLLAADRACCQSGT